MKQRICRCCDGTGRELDSLAIGRDLRKQRRRLGLSLRYLAESMGLSACYLSHLERGLRDWNPRLIAIYRAALNLEGPR